MHRSLVLAFALALAPALLVPVTTAKANDRTQPMRFDLRRQFPADQCGDKCATWISASGVITADSARDFKSFMQGRNLRAVTVVLDSDGGSVLGAIALGREIRKAALATTVGRFIERPKKEGDKHRESTDAMLSPRANCESMCAFVLLGGVQRNVPPEARVMVHQIWLGDRRDDPTASIYSAEDLSLVQRDIGRLAQYTAEMGGSIALLDLALRIPPWEPLHVMTRAEIRDTRLVTDDVPPATMAVSPRALPPPVLPVTNGVHVTRANERRWDLFEHEGRATLARRHPLTIEGEPIGSFDLVLACGATPDHFDLSYVEHRHATGGPLLVTRLTDVTLRAGRSRAKLKITSSEFHADRKELVSFARGVLPAAMIRAFADAGSHSMVIETRSSDKASDQDSGNETGIITVIRLGNTGTQKNLPHLTESCANPLGDRAMAETPRKTGGVAAR